MNNIDDKRQIALLEATLREILRINREATYDKGGSMDLETALEGELLVRWQDIKKKARTLLGTQ
jgi:hypothetical protein